MEPWWMEIKERKKEPKKERNIVHYIVYSILYIVYIVLYIVYNVLYIIYNIIYTIYNIYYIQKTWQTGINLLYYL